MMPSLPFTQPYRDFFRAKLTGKTECSGSLFNGRWMYDWVEQSQSQTTGVDQNANPARRGSYTAPNTYSQPAVEINDIEIDDDSIAAGVYVFLRQRASVKGFVFYEFAIGAVGGGGANAIQLVKLTGGTEATGPGAGFQPGRILDPATLTETIFVWVREPHGTEIPGGAILLGQDSGLAVDETEAVPVYNVPFGVYGEFRTLDDFECIGGEIGNKTYLYWKGLWVEPVEVP